MLNFLNIMIYIVLIILFIYTASYGVWTWKKKNYIGAIMVLILAVSVVALPLWTMLTGG